MYKNTVDKIQSKKKQQQQQQIENQQRTSVVGLQLTIRKFLSYTFGMISL